MPTAPVVLRTERLLLRPMDEGDIAFTAAALGDIEVSRRLARVPHPYTEPDARSWLAETRRARVDGSMDHFIIELREGAAPIGAIGLSHASDGSPAEVGYWIARERWGLGYAREALAAVVRFAFHARTPVVERIEARVHAANDASARVLEACGFADAGPADCASLATGRQEPARRYELRRA